MIEKGRCDEGLIWNPSKCECKGDKSCDVGQYLDYESCKCRKKLIDKLVEGCSENIHGNELIYNKTLNDYKNVCNFCTIFVILLIFFIISTGLSCAFVYFHWYLKKGSIVLTIY